MNTNNYLNIPTAARDTSVYRIICIPRLFEFFEKRLNVLVKPQKWEDPFENFVSHSQQVYGQCWTFQSASDAMWRIYSRNSDAVRIRSTVRKLADSLSRTRGKEAHVEAFIGQVQYLRNAKLMAFAKNISQKSAKSSARTLAQTLLVKRPAFKHEREVRLLFIPRDNAHLKLDTFCYSVDPNILVDQIMIDPRVSKEETDALKQKIRSHP
jgi:hypothetical protein